MSAKFYSIQAAAQELGVTIQTLRNWDDWGKFSPMRLPNNHRLYTAEDIEKLRVFAAAIKTRPKNPHKKLDR